jgi:hypothetical protein
MEKSKNFESFHAAAVSFSKFGSFFSLTRHRKPIVGGFLCLILVVPRSNQQVDGPTSLIFFCDKIKLKKNVVKFILG